MKRNEDMNMLLNYLLTGISAFLNILPLAFIVFCVFTGVKLLLKTMLIPFRMLCEFIWILIMFMILKITGIIGGDFGTTSIIMGNVNFSLDLFEEGLSIAALLNIALFIPFGFFSTIVFRNLQSKWIYGILIGLIFSGIIEFLQIFAGRFVQINDILMNTLGTFLGFILCSILSKLNRKMKIKKHNVIKKGN